MKPEDVERLLGRFEPAPPPERLERSVLAEGEKLLGRAPAREARLWRYSGVAAAGLVLAVILWRILVPAPGDPGLRPCQGAVEFKMHLDSSAAAGPPAFPSGAPDLEAYAPLFRRADAVKPLADELRWQHIPWVTDLEEARRSARTEHRPLFLWVSSDDPLGRCCGCAAGLRAGPLSREEVVRRVSEGFVPAALDKRILPKDFVQSLQRQKQQYHGIWIVSPEGKVLAGHEGAKAKDLEGWTREILETLETGLKAFGPVAPRTVAPAELLPDRGAGVRPDGSVSLAVYARLMHRGARDGPIALDSLALTAEEWARFVPPGTAAGTEWVLPDAVARKFCRIVSPVSDPDFMPRPVHAKKAELRAAVASIDGAAATIRLSGRWETEHSTSEGKPIRAAASGEGVAVFDLGKRAMRSLLLVTTGVFGQVPESREAGAVVEWQAATP